MTKHGMVEPETGAASGDVPAAGDSRQGSRPVRELPEKTSEAIVPTAPQAGVLQRRRFSFFK